VTSHPPWEELVDYFAGDLDAAREGVVEEHLMTCAACTDDANRVTHLTATLRALVPPLATPETIAAMRARGLRVEDSVTAPGEDRHVTLGPHLDVLVHHLTGVDPRATEASFSLRVVETGEVLVRTNDVPIDENGQVHLVCQPHFATLPPNVIASVTTRGPGGTETVSEYVLRHRFVG
jgi:hypothetical protein